MNKFNEQVANYWSRVAKRKELGYWNLPGWKEHQNLLASGTTEKDWLDILIPKAVEYSGGAGIGLSLGCGSGYLEPVLLEKGLCSEVEACDISKDLIEQAQSRADEKKIPIKYFQCDLNNAQFLRDRYDFVIASGILHHIQNLEGLFEKVKNCLKPRGVFLVYDYVSPTRFQWTDQQKSTCNKLLERIPLRYRLKRGYPWYYYAARLAFRCLPFLQFPFIEKILQSCLPERLFFQFIRLKQARLIMNEVLAPPKEQFMVTDPSEAIRSEEVLPLLRNYFKEEALIPQGGTIAIPLFSRTVANFVNDQKGAKLIDTILEKERCLIENIEIPSNLAACMLTKC